MNTGFRSNPFKIVSRISPHLRNAGYRVQNAVLRQTIAHRYRTSQPALEHTLHQASERIASGKRTLLLVYPPKGPTLTTSYGEAVSLSLMHRKIEAEEKGWRVNVFNATKEARPLNALAQRVRQFDPTVIAFASTSPSEAMAFSMAKHLLKNNLGKGRLIVKGGPGTEFSYPYLKGTLKGKSPIQLFFLGDASPSFSQFLGAAESGRIDELRNIKGIGIIQDHSQLATHLPKTMAQRTIPNPLDILAMEERPWPVLFRKGEKLQSSSRLGRIQTMSNCGFGCGFCAVSLTMGAQTRMPVEAAIEQIRGMVQNGITNFYFEDATFLADRIKQGVFTKVPGISGQDFSGWTTKFLKEMRKIRHEVERNGSTIRFGIQTRIDSLSEQTVKELSEAGCTNVFLGIETFSKDSLTKMHKGSKNEEPQVKETFHNLLKYGINPTASIIAGKYTGGLNNFSHTLEKLKEFGAQEIFIQAGAIYPGTGDWKGMSQPAQDHVALSYLAPNNIMSGVSKRGPNTEDQMQYHRWDTTHSLRKYYQLAPQLLGDAYTQINPGHYLSKNLYLKSRVA